MSGDDCTSDPAGLDFSWPASKECKAKRKKGRANWKRREGEIRHCMFVERDQRV